MRVTKYNSDGSVNTVREYHEPLPSYVTSFDENHSFLNISDIDIAIASQNKNSFEKTLVLEKMRFLISKDYKNYLDSISNNENVVDFVEKLSTIPIDFEYWDSKDKILSSLLRCYNKSYDSYGLTDIEKLLETLVHGSDLLEVILYHILQYHEYGSVIGPHYLPENEFCKSFLNVIHRLYYVLIRHFGFDSDFKIVNDITHTIHPFATLFFSKSNLPLSFRNNQMLIRLMETLFQNESKRKDVYRLLYSIQSLSNTDYNSPSHNCLSMVTGSYNNDLCIIPANPSNGVEDTMIELTPEEVVSLNIQCNASEKQINIIKDTLQAEFNLFSEINGDVLKNNTTQRAIRHFRFRKSSQLSSKNWFIYYHAYLDKLEKDYIQQERRNEDLDCPYYYYYLLVDICNVSEEYEFDGEFLTALVNLAINKKCLGRSDLYEQMFRLNYIGQKAGFILDSEANSQDDWIQKLKDKLLNGPDKDIAEKLLLNDPIDDNDDYNTIINKIIVFLCPLFNNDRYLKVNSEFLKGKLKSILKCKPVESGIKKIDIRMGFKPFNVKLVLNIIGFLSTKECCGENVFVESRIGNSLTM